MSFTEEPQDAFHADFCAERLKTLSDPSRLRIIDVLRYGELSVGDIAEFLETQVASVSHHLQCLKLVQIVTSRREGRFNY
jgi:DNA-binding transcriptional ArsR family regulator